MKPFKASLYWRVLAWFFVANLLTLFLGGMLTQRFIEYSTAVEIDWTTLARDADQAYETGGTPALTDWAAQQRQQGIRATLYENGQALVPIRLYHGLANELSPWLKQPQNVVLQPRRGLYLAVQQVTGRDGTTRQLVALSRSHQHLPRQKRAEIYLIVQLALSLLFIALVGWRLARSVARPVEALRQATQRMARGELSTRVGPEVARAPGELADLAEDFDTMAQRIEALVAHDRLVLQDLSHELRSPLARLQLILDLARRSSDPYDAAPYFEQAEREIERLDQMLGDMLALSRLEGGLPGMQSESLDLVELASECVASARIDADDVNVDLQLVANGPVVVTGYPMLLERALHNLLSNAIKFSPAGGRVDMEVHRQATHARISVRDHGPGVPEAELDQLTRPFFRGSNAARAAGHGLGLAIVQRVLKAHGGSVEISNAADGGLRVALQLPLEQKPGRLPSAAS